MNISHSCDVSMNKMKGLKQKIKEDINLQQSKIIKR